MNEKEREELTKRIEKLEEVGKAAEEYLNSNDYFKNDDGSLRYQIKNVIRYNKEIELTKKSSENKEKDKFYLYVVELESDNPELEDALTELEFLVEEDKDGTVKVNSIKDLMQEYEGFEEIGKLKEKTKESEVKPEEEKTEEDKEYTKDDLNELKEKENEESLDEEEKETKLTSDTTGATSLDQEIDRRSLRNLIGLDGDDAYIKPISASEVKRKYGVNINTREGIEIIKQDGTSRLAGEDIFKQDVQEGNNAFNRDLNIEVDGDVEYKSNTTSLELVNMPGHFVSMGYDDLTTKREIKFSKRSGREGHREPEKELLKEGASEYRDPDQRNMTRRNEEGIGEGDEIRDRQETYEKSGIENDRVENIDNYNENDNAEYIVISKDDKVPGKGDMTFEEWGEFLGEGTDKIIERFQREIQKNPKREPEEIVDVIDDDYNMLEQQQEHKH